MRLIIVMGLLSKNLLESIHISQGENGMIRKMYQNGMSMQNISLITGMTEQRIRDAIKDF